MTMRSVAASLVPPWLEPLLVTHFFASCPLHRDSARNECNMFCLDCSSAGGGGGGSSSSSAGAAAFCFYCRSDLHSGHRVIQIRRSSYHDVVRVMDVQPALDISGVQTYVINSARVLFLNERPQPRGGGSKGSGGAGSGVGAASSPHICEICSRSLLDPFRFCSLGCKLVGINRNGDASFIPSNFDEGATVDAGESSGVGTTTTTAAAAAAGQESSSKMGDEERSRDRGGRDRGRGGGSRDGARASAPPNPRRRKGIPHRAPFGT